MEITVVGLGGSAYLWRLSSPALGTRFSGETSALPLGATVNSDKEPFPGEAHLQEKQPDVGRRPPDRRQTYMGKRR